MEKREEELNQEINSEKKYKKDLEAEQEQFGKRENTVRQQILDYKRKVTAQRQLIEQVCRTFIYLLL